MVLKKLCWESETLNYELSKQSLQVKNKLTISIKNSKANISVITTNFECLLQQVILNFVPMVPTGYSLFQPLNAVYLETI